jgi:Fe-S-cluster containining protein
VSKRADDDDRAEYERVGPLAPGFENGAMLAAGLCPLLGADNLCTIYPSRPNCCVAMQAGSDQCQLARGMAGLPPLQPQPAGEVAP